MKPKDFANKMAILFPRAWVQVHPVHVQEVISKVKVCYLEALTKEYFQLTKIYGEVNLHGFCTALLVTKTCHRHI